MAITYELIASTVLTTNTTTVSLTSIPATYTDLILKCSVRGSLNGADFAAQVTFNNDTASNYSMSDLRGNGATASTGRQSNQSQMQITNAFGGGASLTANTFNNFEIYIPSYRANANKPVIISTANENNSATAYITQTAGLWRNTATISSIQIETFGVSGSSFYLYGIKNS